MTEAEKYIYQSPLGPMAIAHDGTALIELQFCEDKADETNTPRDANNISGMTCRWLDWYFSHTKSETNTCPPLPTLNPQGTSFQQRVWQELIKIPYGHTITYGELARRVGCRSAQVVGQAVGHNPIAIIIPCHRVVGSTGLGGYAYGTERKRKLLDLER